MTYLIGIDPGLRRTGWGIVDVNNNHIRFIGAGVVSSEADLPLADRLQSIYRGLSEIIETRRPQEAAVEETVVNRNPSSSLKLGHARGVTMLAAAHASLPVSEYASKAVKRAVTGTGAADKDQVAHMVRVLLPGCGTLTNDASDALAVVLCHAHHRATAMRIGLEVTAR